ncbi:TRAF3-interacting protein 1 [Kappamyces sp. JEL0680]|nr:TRAF3-interacting protein 1 [Kappamyces sp. JEL0680]
MNPPEPKPRGRPMSARPPPPKKKSVAAPEEEPASFVPIHKVEDSHDDDEFVVKAVDDEPQYPANDAAMPVVGQQHGGLVSKMLQTKKELEGGKEPVPAGDKEKKTLPVGAKQINALRESIQQLCQSTNPLGKTMDYLQEDVDAMNKELAMWKRESESFALQATEQQKVTKETLKPLEDKLSTIELGIQEQIAILKGEILANDLKTEKILKGIASAT